MEHDVLIYTLLYKQKQYQRDKNTTKNILLSNRNTDENEREREQLSDKREEVYISFRNEVIYYNLKLSSNSVYRLTTGVNTNKMEMSIQIFKSLYTKRKTIIKLLTFIRRVNLFRLLHVLHNVSNPPSRMNN